MTGQHVTLLPEMPPVLFEVQCFEEKIDFGGFPWHFISTPLKKKNVFDVRRLSNDALVSLCNEHA